MLTLTDFQGGRGSMEFFGNEKKTETGCLGVCFRDLYYPVVKEFHKPLQGPLLTNQFVHGSAGAHL